MYHHSSGNKVIAYETLPMTKGDCQHVFNYGYYQVPRTTRLVKVKFNEKQFFTDVRHGEYSLASLTCYHSDKDFTLKVEGGNELAITGAIVIDEYYLEFQRYNTKVVDKKTMLPNHISSEKEQNSGFNPSIGRWYHHLDFKNCELFYQEVHLGQALSPKLDPGANDLIVVNDTQNSKYNSFRLGGTQRICNTLVHTTKLSKFYVLFTKNTPKLNLEQVKPVNMNLDVALASLGGFVHTEFTNRMKEVYQWAAYEDCKQNKQMIDLELSVVSQGGVPGTDYLGLGKGSVVHVRGSVLDVTTCEKTHATVRETDQCWKDLPIMFDKQEVFRDTKTHVIKKSSSRVACKYDAAIFEINGDYFFQEPKYRHVNEEVIVIEPTLTSTNGILDYLPYTIRSAFGEDISDVYKAIMFPISKVDVQDIMINGLMTQSGGYDSGEPGFGEEGSSLLESLQDKWATVWKLIKAKLEDLATAISLAWGIVIVILYLSNLSLHAVSFKCRKETWLSLVRPGLIIWDKVKDVATLLEMDKAIDEFKRLRAAKAAKKSEDGIGDRERFGDMLESGEGLDDNVSLITISGQLGNECEIETVSKTKVNKASLNAGDGCKNRKIKLAKQKETKNKIVYHVGAHNK